MNYSMHLKDNLFLYKMKKEIIEIKIMITWQFNIRPDNPKLESHIKLMVFELHINLISGMSSVWERSGSVVECLTRDRRAAGSSLIGITALCP